MFAPSADGIPLALKRRFAYYAAMHNRWVLSLINLVLATLTTISISAYADATDIRYRILTFNTGDLREATETLLYPTQDGKLATENISTKINSDGCEDLLTDFQKEPLAEMLSRQYITQAMFDLLMNFKALGIKPQQLVLISQFSEMPHLEAERLFSGNIPKSRLTLATDSKNVRIERGTVYFVRGYEPVLNAQGKLSTAPLTLPWEIGDSLPSRLKKKMDRTKVTNMIEIGRAFSHNGVLPGDIQRAVHLLINYLSNEARTLKISPKDILLTAHFLDSQHTRLFSKLFPVRPLNPELANELENDFQDAIERAFAAPLPVGKQWLDYEDALVVSTLERGMARFPLEQLSNFSDKMGARTDQQLNGAAAIDFQMQRIQSLREHYDFSHPDFPMSAHPIIIRDLGSSFSEAKIFQALKRIGKFESRAQAEEFIDSLDVTTFDPDVYSAVWTDKVMIHVPLPAMTAPMNGQTIEPLKSYTINNLNPRLAEQYPITYLAAVMLSVRDMIRTRIENLSPEFYALTLHSINGQRREVGKSALSSFDPEVYLEHFPLILTSSFAVINEQAKRLGARPAAGQSVYFDFNRRAVNPEDAQMGVRMVPATYYKFDRETLEQMAKYFPQYADHARRHLKPGLWDYKFRMSLSGIF